MTIHVRNWEKHQHRDFAKRKSQTWLRLDAAIFDDPKITELNAGEFRAYIKLLTLAAKTGNEIPETASYLRAHLGTNWRHFCDRFVACSFISQFESVSKTPAKRASSAREKRTKTALDTGETHTELRPGPPSTVPEDALQRFDPDELEAWEPPADNVVPLDSRRPRGEINGKPIGDVVKPLLDGLLARAQSP